MKNEELYIKFDVYTIDHLGARLYNSIPPILTELVANSWDADATNVQVNISNDCINIEDNGFGMLRSDVQTKYLTIGVQKREISGDTTPSGRYVMGRKGIGKLAMFGIADYVKIETCSQNAEGILEKTTFEINYKELLDSKGSYKPIETQDSSLNTHGTKITLTQIKKQRMPREAIKKSLARSLPVIFTNDNFKVLIDGNEINIEDRDIFQKLEAIWFFGSGDGLDKIKTHALKSVKSENVFDIPINTNVSGIYGWIGTAKTPNALKNKDFIATLNEVSIVVREKIAEQNILPEIGKTDRMVISYIAGEIYADFLDDDKKPDIATSSRQSIDRDDPRLIALFEWSKEAMGIVKKGWESMRDKSSENELAILEPALADYYNLLPEADKKGVKQFYKVASKIHYEDRATLYRSLTLAYEKIRRSKHSIAIEEKLNDDNVDLFVELAKEASDVEQLSYYEIVSKRLDVMVKAKEYLEKNIEEKHCQELIYKNLWVLNPFWEKYQTSEHSESVKRMEKAVKRHDANENIVKGRIDIWIAEHFDVVTVIELKRPGRTLIYNDLAKQVMDYEEALREEWFLTNPSFQGQLKVNLMVIVGEKPKGHKDSFDRQGVTLHTYQEVIGNIETMYSAYLKEQKESQKFIEVIDRLQLKVNNAILDNLTQDDE